jgi:hypothetical protein
MTKDSIAKDTIQKGLNICKSTLGVDGSAVVPSIVGMVLEQIGSCKTCAHLDAVDVCQCKQAMYDVWMGDNLDWFCAEYKPLEK